MRRQQQVAATEWARRWHGTCNTCAGDVGFCGGDVGDGCMDDQRIEQGWNKGAVQGAKALPV